MKKRLIFDLDNTLIIWKKEYIKALEDTLNYYNIDIETNSPIIDSIIESLEKKYEQLTKQILLDEINHHCSLNLKIDFIDKLFQNQGTLADKNQEIINTLEYLSQKYELVVLTNYFKEVQENRLIKAGIRKYFTKIYAGDEVPLKPRKQAFEKAIGNYKKEECLMIGDNLYYDIEGANAIGLDAIMLDYFGKTAIQGNYKVINQFNKLKDLLERETNKIDNCHQERKRKK